MRKMDFGPEGDGPYEYEGQNQQKSEYNFQAYAEDGKVVFIFSDTPQNYSDPDLSPLENSIQMTGAVRESLNEMGVKDIGNVEILYHKPENVTGNNPETFEKVNYEFDLNGLHEQYRNGREDLTADQVAEKIGPENFVEKQFAEEPTMKEEISEQPDYGAADLASQRTADNEASHQNLRNMANEARHEYEPEF